MHCLRYYPKINLKSKLFVFSFIHCKRVHCLTERPTCEVTIRQISKYLEVFLQISQYLDLYWKLRMKHQLFLIATKPFSNSANICHHISGGLAETMAIFEEAYAFEQIFITMDNIIWNEPAFDCDVIEQSVHIIDYQNYMCSSTVGCMLKIKMFRNLKT